MESYCSYDSVKSEPGGRIALNTHLSVAETASVDGCPLPIAETGDVQHVVHRCRSGSLINVDANGDARRQWLRALPVLAMDATATVQSDFEKSLPFRLTILVAVFVIGLNLLSDQPSSKVMPTHARQTT